MIGIEIEAPAPVDFARVRRLALAVERLAVEGRGRDKFRRRLAGIERGAARIAIDVDDRARKFRAHERRPERAGEIVEFVEPPVRVLAGEPRTDESRLEVEEVCPGVRNADDERRVPALDDEPVGTLVAHRAGLSSEGSATAPTASIAAPLSHEARRRGDVRMKVAVVVEMGNLAAHDGAQGFERRARKKRRMEVAGLRGRDEFDADDRKGVLGHGLEARCGMSGHRHVIFLVGGGRDRIDARRKSAGLVLRRKRRGGDLADHES